MVATLVQQFVSTGPAQLLIASIWQGLLLTAIAWGCLAVTRRHRFLLPASTRFKVWLMVFLLVALLPCLTLAHGLIWPSSGTAAAPSYWSLHLDAGWAFAVEGLWVLASLVAFCRLWATVKQMRAMFHQSQLVPYSALDAELQSIVSRSAARPVEIRLSGTVDAPSVIGFFRPAVLVPSSLWSTLAPRDMQAIILHEKAHLDRGDDWTNLLQKLLRALFPLNPALAWAERSLCREREQACDDAVVQAAGNARAYATCLTRVAETRLVKRAAALAPGLWKRHSELALRVEHLLQPHRPVSVWGSAWLSRGLVGACLLIAGSSALLLQRCPGLVSFSAAGPVAVSTAAPPLQAQTNRVVRASYSLPSPESLQVKKVPMKPRHRSAYAATRIQYLQVRSSGDGMTLILFTVQVPRRSAVRQAPPVFYPFLLPDSWIESQI